MVADAGLILQSQLNFHPDRNPKMKKPISDAPTRKQRLVR